MGLLTQSGNRRALLLGVCAAALALPDACSSYAEHDPAAAGDADAAPRDDGASPDAPSRSNDAGADIGPESGACSWFCEDFDHVWPSPGWGSAAPYQDGSIARTGDAFVSTPFALRAEAPSNGLPTPAGLWPRTRFGAASGVHCTMNLEVESRGTDLADLIVLDATTAGGPYRAAISDNGSKAWTELDETGGPQDTFAQLPLGTWQRIGIDLALGTPTRVAINGAVVSHPQLSPAADAGRVGFTSVTLTIGAARNNGTSAGDWRVDYDDVACDLDP